MKKFKEINDKNDPKMPLSLKNYILLLAGLIVIILGFVLMAGGGSDSPDEFTHHARPDPGDRRLHLRNLRHSQTILNPDFSDRRKPGCNPRFPDTEISPRTVKWKPFKLSSWASSRV